MSKQANAGSPGKFRVRSVLPQLPHVEGEFAACTIIAKNYLSMARVLAESFQQHNPGCPFFVLLLDPVEAYFEPEKEPFHLLETRQLCIDNLEGFLFKYNILEASTAVKPTLIKKLFQEHAIKKLIYLDPDILVLRPLEELSKLLDEYPIVLTPHITSPYPDAAKPGDHDILQAGSFNLGFIGMQNTPGSQSLLKWWESKLYHHGLLAFERNMFVDQRWMDMAPGLCDGLKILRDPGYNVAYWNLHERRIELIDDKVLVNGQPCYFFHFSGFSPTAMEVVSKHQNRFTMAQLGDARYLFFKYRDLLAAHGWNETKNWPYTYDCFDNGIRIPDSARRYYWSLGVSHIAHLGNPFTWLNEVEPTNIKSQQWRTARDLDNHPYGVNVVGYVTSEKGVGEAVRSNLRILQAAGVPHVANNFVDTGSHNPENLPANYANENPYIVNLINVNADQVPYFVTRNKNYLNGRYNVGYWAWELSSFPKEWYGSFTYLDEIWVPSNFTRESVATASPLAVTCVPHAIDPQLEPSAEWDRERLQISPETYVFMFFFDFHSFLERKNPLGLIRAFRRAFGDRRDVLLLMKSVHADAEPAGLRILTSESRGANIRLFDQVLSRQATRSLMDLADCYVSLHRSEGFGLTLSEAMMCAKPVIATAYSGNMDFMTGQNSFLVPYRLIEIETDHGPYKRGCVWADPDLDRASEYMRHVFQDRTAAEQIAKRGQAEVLAKLHPRAIAEIVKQRLASVGFKTPESQSARLTEAGPVIKSEALTSSSSNPTVQTG